jgi:hypothetical protein
MKIYMKRRLDEDWDVWRADDETSERLDLKESIPWYLEAYSEACSMAEQHQCEIYDIPQDR